MFRSAFRPFSSMRYTRNAHTARYFHHVTTDFITHDARGNIITRKVPIIIGNPGETYILIEEGVGNALRAASPFISTSAACVKIDVNSRFSTIRNTSVSVRRQCARGFIQLRLTVCFHC